MTDDVVGLRKNWWNWYQLVTCCVCLCVRVHAHAPV